jgi:NAD(P)-dependent dehydrogenase (short-subunit alcohol dehydrogenase family)
VDGFEFTLAVNVLAPFLLAHLLRPALRAAAPSRVINVTSHFARFGRVDFGDLQSERSYSGDRAYMQSKLALEMLTWELAERERGSGVTANCVEPGLVATDLLRERWWWRAPVLRALWRRVFLAPHDGARAAIIAASSPELAGITGRCIDRHGRLVRTSPRGKEPLLRRRLWQTIAELASVGDEQPAPRSAQGLIQ